ncbi:MAG: hypothetical protein V3S07_08610, partial [Micropepsaceae bacterium]
MRRIGFAFFPSIFLLALLMVHSAAEAQTNPAPAGAALIAPERIIVYTHAALEYREFVDPLICALQSVLQAEVLAKNVDFVLTQDMLEAPGQFTPLKIADAFMQTTATDEHPRTFKFLLLPYDLKAERYNYLFAQTFGGAATPFHVSIVSTARLDPMVSLPGPLARANILSSRIYKIAV